MSRKTMGEVAGDLVGAMRQMQQQSLPHPQMSIGQVLRAAPLKLRCMGLDIDQADLRINESLLVGYSPKLVGNLPGTCPDGGTNTPVTTGQLTRGEFALKAGDQVVCFSEDGQIFTILCKVVAM